MNKKILLLTDSLALPRTGLDSEKCEYNDTWPELLRRQGYLIHQVSIGGATVEDLLRQCDYHKMFNPDIVIIQSGIVDCAPRFASKLELQILKRMPVIGKPILNILSNKKVRKFRNKKYTSSSNYKNAIQKIKAFFKDSRVYAIDIIPSQPGYEKLAEGITKNISECNSIIHSVFGDDVIKMKEIPLEAITKDFHHINSIGHQYVYQSILKILNTNG